MKTMLKVAMVTGLVSAGVLAGGAASHAADLDGQSSFTSHGQLAFSGNQSVMRGLDLNSSNQINLSMSEQNAHVNAQNRQSATTTYSIVESNSKGQAKGCLEAKSNNAPLKTQAATLNTNITSDKKVSGSGGASLNWNSQFVAAGGYYISADRQTGRLTAGASSLTNTDSSHSAVLDEKNVTSRSTKIEVNSTNKQQSEFKPNSVIQTNVKQNNNVSVSADQNSVDGNTSSQFDLLSTLTQAFNLK